MNKATYERPRLLEEFFGTCNASEIRWVLLRGRVTLDTPGKDVDLLVDAGHQRAFEEVVRSVGGVVQPGRVHPSHRTYRIGRPLRDAVPLDVVTRIHYRRERQLSSGLEQGLLERRVRAEGWLYELGPTDLFWTVLLHCLLDKGYFTERRVAELSAAVPVLDRASEGERFTEGLLPPDWSADRVVEAVRSGDLVGLEALAALLTPRRPGLGIRRNPRWGLDMTAARVYNRLWLAAGFGAPVRVDAVLEEAALPSSVTGVHRRPGVVDVSVQVASPDLSRATGALRRAGYRELAGWWSRLDAKGLERVRVTAGTWFAEPGQPPSGTLPLGGRQHCRWTVPEKGPDGEALEGAR